jgi:hypothetical protein
MPVFRTTTSRPGHERRYCSLKEARGEHSCNRVSAGTSHLIGRMRHAAQLRSSAKRAPVPSMLTGGAIGSPQGTLPWDQARVELAGCMRALERRLEDTVGML